MGIVCVGRYNGCYIIISEYVHTPYKNAVSTLLLVFEQFVAFINAFYFKFISINWIYLQIFGVAVNLVAVIGSFFIPESPEYLYSFYKFDETRKVINWIGEKNGKSHRLDSDYTFDTEFRMQLIKLSMDTQGSS